MDSFCVTILIQFKFIVILMFSEEIDFIKTTFDSGVTYQQEKSS